MPGRVRSNGQPVPVQKADWIKYAQGLLAADKPATRRRSRKTRMP
jgi:hypothetical protein